MKVSKFKVSSKRGFKKIILRANNTHLVENLRIFKLYFSNGGDELLFVIKLFVISFSLAEEILYGNRRDFCEIKITEGVTLT